MAVIPDAQMLEVPEEAGESIVVELKYAKARIYLKEFPEGFGYSYDYEYGCGNYSGQLGTITRPVDLFPTPNDSFVAALRHGLRHFDPEKLSPCDSCVSDAQRTTAEEMMARLEKHLAMRGVYMAPHVSKSIPAPAPANELQPSLF